MNPLKPYGLLFFTALFLVFALSLPLGPAILFFVIFVAVTTLAVLFVDLSSDDALTDWYMRVFGQTGELWKLKRRQIRIQERTTVNLDNPLVDYIVQIRDPFIANWGRWREDHIASNVKNAEREVAQLASRFQDRIDDLSTRHTKRMHKNIATYQLSKIKNSKEN
ncbi:hypothetical protein E4H12_05300 [Candidatus Thorarchaeota archaeon]|nr:MAG: hypothetical protein E4H12_05300 [Candidatus Thorarchaeota archaeon]